MLQYLQKACSESLLLQRKDRQWLSATFFLLLLLVAFGARGQHNHDKHPCTIELKVLDKETRQGLPFASIRIGHLNKHVVTDSVGYLKMDHLCDDVCHLLVHFVGYRPLETSFYFQSDTAVSIYLSEDQVFLESINIIDKHEHKEVMHSLQAQRLSAQDLAASKPKGLAQSLEGITGVSVLTTGGQAAKPMIHGLHSNRILILQNGVKLQGQQWGQEHAPEIDVFMAEELSVVKGAASIKYGPEALGGVVLVQPAPLPEDGKLAGEVFTGFRSNGRMGIVSATLEGGIKGVKGLGWRVYGTLKYGGDLRAPHYFLTNTGTREGNFATSAGWKKKGWNLQAFFSQYHTEIGLLKGTTVLGSLADLEQAFAQKVPALTSSSFSYKIGLPRQEVRHQLLKLHADKELAAGKLTWVYSWQQNLRQEFERRLGDLLSKRPTLHLQIQTHQLDMSFSHHTVRKVTGEWGISTAYQDNNNIAGTGRLPLIPNFNSLDAGIFVVERYALTHGTLEAGVRFDNKILSVRGRDFRNQLYEDKGHFRSVTASAGGNFQLNAKSQLQFNMGMAWRAPHPAEMYSFGKKQSAAAIEYGLLIGRNSQIMSLKDAHIKNEQGFKALLGYQARSDKWQAEGNLYANYIKNYVFLRPEGVTVLLNGPYPYYRYAQTNAFFKGAEGSVRFAPRAAWQLEANMSTIWAKDVKHHDYLLFIPANHGGISAMHTWKQAGGWKDAFVKMGVKGVAKPHQSPKRIVSIAQLIEAAEKNENIFAEDQRIFDLMPAPRGYVLLNLSAGIRRPLGNGMLSFSFDAGNLLNQAYRSYTNRLRYFADEPGRDVGISVKYMF